MGATSAVYGLVSSIVAAAGAAYGGYQTKKAADYNADVAEAQAQAARNKAEYNEKLHRERVQRLLSKQRALYGKSGVEMAGSPLLVQEDTLEQGELDALAIRYGGDVEAARARSAANLYKMQGRSAAASGFSRAGSTLLSGYARYKAAQPYQPPKAKKVPFGDRTSKRGGMGGV